MDNMALTSRPQTVRLMQMNMFIGVNNLRHVGLLPLKFPGSFFHQPSRLKSIYALILYINILPMML